MERDTLTTYLSLAMSGITLEKKQAKEIVTSFDSLNEQLAKANERVVILEKERDHAQRMYNSLLGDLSAGYGALSIPECESQLNKFAIEQQVRALDKFYCLVVTSGEPVTTQSVRNYIEQLRKEQE